MLQEDIADDFMAGTGESHSVREFCELAFREAGIELEWKGSGTDEVGVIRSVSTKIPRTQPQTKTTGDERSSNVQQPLPPTSSEAVLQPQTGHELVAIDPRYLCPTEVEFLLADSTRARDKLVWEPKVTFKELVRIMVVADLRALEELRRCRDVIRQIMNEQSGKQ